MIWLSIILAEAGLLATCLGAGAALATRMGMGDKELILPAALCLGLTALGAVGVVVVIVGGAAAPGRVQLMFQLLTAAGIVAIALHVRVLATQPRLLAALVGVLALFSVRNWIFFTNDSFFLHYVADIGVERGRLPMEDYAFHFLGHPIWLHVAHMWANALGEPYVRWAFPAAFLMAAWVAIAAVRAQARSGPASCGWLGFAAVAMLFGSYQMVIQAQMANHHMMVALILLLAGVHLVRDASLSAAVISGLALASVPLMRMEGSMLVGLFALGMCRVLDTPARALAVTGIPTVVALPWLAYLAGHRTDGMLSLAQLLLGYGALVACGAGVVGLLALARTPVVAGMLDRWYMFCAAGAGGMLGLAALISPATTFSNLLIVPQNMLVFARWGVFWDLALLVVIGLAMARLWLKGLPASPFACFAAVTGLVIAMLFLVGAMRHPYRLNWSDSASRMLVHVAPLAAVWVAERLMALHRALIGADQSVAYRTAQSCGLAGKKSGSV